MTLDTILSVVFKKHIDKTLYSHIYLLNAARSIESSTYKLSANFHARVCQFMNLFLLQKRFHPIPSMASPIRREGNIAY